jgi:hypothetical protein
MRLDARSLRVVALSTLTLFWSSNAPCRAEGESPYTLAQTFGAALRMLRVDLGLEVTEKDANAAYLLFRYQLVEDPKRAVPGAIELIELPNQVKILVKIPQLPESHERLLRDRLTRKLHEEFGAPPKRPDAPKTPPIPAEKPAKP